MEEESSYVPRRVEPMTRRQLACSLAIVLIPSLLVFAAGAVMANWMISRFDQIRYYRCLAEDSERGMIYSSLASADQESHPVDSL